MLSFCEKIHLAISGIKFEITCSANVFVKTVNDSSFIKFSSNDTRLLSFSLK